MSAGKSAGVKRLREMIVLALFSAIMVATQVAMAALPNIHLIAVLIIISAMLFGWKCLYSIYLFVLLEGLIYGFTMWVINYLYVWPILAVIAVLCRKNRSRIFWAAVAGVFGLLFGALCSIPYFLTGGWAAGFSYWVSGIPFDLIHCVSNAVLTFILVIPLYNLCNKVLSKS